MQLLFFYFSNFVWFCVRFFLDSNLMNDSDTWKISFERRKNWNKFFSTFFCWNFVGIFFKIYIEKRVKIFFEFLKENYQDPETQNKSRTPDKIWTISNPAFKLGTKGRLSEDLEIYRVWNLWIFPPSWIYFLAKKKVFLWNPAREDAEVFCFWWTQFLQNRANLSFIRLAKERESF